MAPATNRKRARKIGGVSVHTPTDPNDPDEGIYTWFDPDERFALVWMGGKRWLLMSTIAEFDNSKAAGEAMRALGVPGN